MPYSFRVERCKFVVYETLIILLLMFLKAFIIRKNLLFQNIVLKDLFILIYKCVLSLVSVSFKQSQVL